VTTEPPELIHMSIHTDTAPPTTGAHHQELEPAPRSSPAVTPLMQTLMTNDARSTPNYLPPAREVPARRHTRHRPCAPRVHPIGSPLSTRAGALMSSPAAITVDPRSHAGQQEISDESMRRDGAAALWANAPANDEWPRATHPRAITRHGWTMRDVATGQVRCARTDDAISTVAAIMRDDATDAVPVINSRGNVVGVITTTDIVDLLARYDPKRQQR
jgi:hypothetical protein